MNAAYGASIFDFLVTDGRIAALALVVLATELAWFGWRARGSVRHRNSMPTLLAGGCIMAALYVALSGGASALIILFLIASLAAHLTDLHVRLKRDA
jgi:hypothetical protein